MKLPAKSHAISENGAVNMCSPFMIFMHLHPTADARTCCMNSLETLSSWIDKRKAHPLPKRIQSLQPFLGVRLPNSSNKTASPCLSCPTRANGTPPPAEPARRVRQRRNPSTMPAMASTLLAMASLLVASLLLVARPGATNSVLATSSDALCSY